MILPSGCAAFPPLSLLPSVLMALAPPPLAPLHTTQNDTNYQCVYAPCAAAPAPASARAAAPVGAATAAAPAVVLLTAVVVFVEVLLHFC